MKDTIRRGFLFLHPPFYIGMKVLLARRRLFYSTRTPLFLLGCNVNSALDIFSILCFFYFLLFLLYSYSYLFIIVFLEYFGKPYLIDPHKIKNYGITCNRVVFIRTLIPSKKQAIEVLYSTYMDSIYILLKILFLLLLILH
nr:ribosomal protein S16 [Tussilago farfara]